MAQRIVDTYRITEQNLAVRRKTLGLTDKDKQLLISLKPWADEIADQVAKDFYDFQFKDRATSAFFENIAKLKNTTIAQLRPALEGTQAEYFRQIFQGASENWGLNYFERRLEVGNVHNRINLPLKLYLASYTLYFRLIRKYLPSAIKDITDEKKRNERINNAFDSILKVMILDIEAVCEGYCLSLLDSIGLDVGSLEVSGGADVTEHMGDIKAAVEKLQDQAKAIATGKLKDEVLKTKVPGNLGDIFAEISKCITGSVTTINGEASKLGAQSKQLASFADSSSAAIKQLKVAVEQLSAASSEIALRTQETAASSKKTQELSESGSKTLQDLLKMINKIKVSMENTMKSVESLVERSNDIKEIAKVITDIADQTNLLSLNTAIEAARAGEAGRGFAVLATEIRKLADSSQKEVKNISKIVDGMMQGTAKTLEGSKLVASEIDQGVAMIKSTNDTFTAIVTQVNDVSKQVNEMAAATEESASASNELSAQAEQQTKQIDQLNDSVKQIDSTTSELIKAVRMFEV